MRGTKRIWLWQVNCPAFKLTVTSLLLCSRSCFYKLSPPAWCDKRGQCRVVECGGKQAGHKLSSNWPIQLFSCCKVSSFLKFAMKWHWHAGYISHIGIRQIVRFVFGVFAVFYMMSFFFGKSVLGPSLLKLLLVFSPQVGRLSLSIYVKPKNKKTKQKKKSKCCTNECWTRSQRPMESVHWQSPLVTPRRSNALQQHSWLSKWITTWLYLSTSSSCSHWVLITADACIHWRFVCLWLACSLRSSVIDHTSHHVFSPSSARSNHRCVGSS